MTSVVAVTATIGARRRDIEGRLLAGCGDDDAASIVHCSSPAAPARLDRPDAEPDVHPPVEPRVFDSFRKSLEDLVNRATPPEERRVIVSRMRETLVQAKVGVQEMRESLERSRQRLEHERRELETVRRRKALATNIGDQETVKIAERYELMHAERFEVVERKIVAQESELSLAEREVEEMSKELRAAMNGAVPPTSSAEAQAAAELDEELSGGGPAAPGGAGRVREEIDSLGRARARADREADAERRLEELKRRMGK